MNDSYLINNDGKVKIIELDKKGKILSKEYEYQDNIDDILINENIIEGLENTKKRINNRINFYNKIIKNNKKSNKYLTLSGLFLVFFSIIVSTLNIGVSGMLLKMLQFIPVFTLLSTSIVLIPLININQKLNDQYRKIKKGSYLELDKIDEQIYIYKERLKDLKEVKTNYFYNEKKNSDFIKVNYKKELEELRNYLFTFYKIGYDKQELVEAYNSGELDKFLKDNFNKEEIIIIKNYLNDNFGKSKVLKPNMK